MRRPRQTSHGAGPRPPQTPATHAPSLPAAGATPGLPLTSRGLRDVLAREGLRPNRRRGQCFLVDRNLLDAIVRAFDPRPGEAVLEVGTGAGNLTALLVRSGAAVLSVERDRALHEIACRLLPQDPRLRVLRRDVLQSGHLAGEVLDAWRALAASAGCRSFALCSNFPYAVAARVILGVLDRGPRPLRVLVGTVQREVAERLTARPGTRAYGALTVSAALRAETRILRRIPPGVFWPPPRVDSAVVRIQPRTGSGGEAGGTALAGSILKALFPLRRRRLMGAMRAVLTGFPRKDLESAVERAALDPERRVGTLDVGEWRRLLEELAPRG